MNNIYNPNNAYYPSNGYSPNNAYVQQGFLSGVPLSQANWVASQMRAGGGLSGTQFGMSSFPAQSSGGGGGLLTSLVPTQAMAGGITNFVSSLFGGQTSTSNVDAVTGSGGPTTRTSMSQYDEQAALEKQAGSSVFSTAGPAGPSVIPGGSSKVSTPKFNPTASTTNWTAKLAGVTASGKKLNQKTLDALKENINTQYTEQLKAIQTQAKQGQLAEQQARQQIAEAAFTRERQLLEAASQRGLGASGLEQLSRVQQRAVVGQQINQLAQQTGLQREQLTNALSQAAAAKNAALTQAEINALTTQLQLDQADFQQGLSLDDRNRAQAYQKFQADLASAEFTNQTEYIQWQKDNAKEQAKLLGVRNKQDALAILTDSNVSEDFKKAWIKLNLDAGFITEQEATEWGAKNLKSVNPEELTNTDSDYTSTLATKGIDLILKTQITANQFNKQEMEIANKNAVWSFKKPDGTSVLLKGTAVLDKNNPESPVYAFKDLPGYQQIQPKIGVALNISGGRGGAPTVLFTYNGKDYDTFQKASEQFQLKELQKG